MHINITSPQEDVILTDICSKSNKKISYVRLNDALEPVKIKKSNITSWSIFKRIHFILKEVFLPKGYPQSVSSDYLEYQIWDTCQAFCSSISGTLCMTAIMQGIGVGSDAATPVSAAITWIMKDGTGMIGSILFAWLKGSKLDADCKKWRLFADVLNDIAMFVELYIPYVVDYSMYMLCLATAFKALVGTAGSSTRAALITHQAIKGNIADVSAKDASQEIFTNLCAMVFGIFILKNVTETDQIWAVMCTATLFHLIFNYKAVRCLKINIFNSERFRLCLRTYLPTSSVPTVDQVNRIESVFLSLGTSDYQICGFSIVFGCSLRKVVKSQKITSYQLEVITTHFQDKKHIILVDNKRKKFYVTFRTDFREVDVLKAYFHCYLIAIAIDLLESEKNLRIVARSRKNSPIYRLKNILNEFMATASDSSIHKVNDTVVQKAYSICEDFVEKEFVAYWKACLDQGWNGKKHLISVDDWRAEWKHLKEKKETSPRKMPVKGVSSTKIEKEKSKIKQGVNLVIS